MNLRDTKVYTRYHFYFIPNIVNHVLNQITTELYTILTKNNLKYTSINILKYSKVREVFKYVI